MRASECNMIMASSYFREGKLRFREVRGLAQSHTALMQQRQNSNLGFLAPMLGVPTMQILGKSVKFIHSPQR